MSVRIMPGLGVLVLASVPALAQVTERVGLGSADQEPTSPIFMGSVSADGRYVAFECASALVPNDFNFSGDIYVRDRVLGTTELVSVAATGGGPGNILSRQPAISADGRYVAFASFATNLVQPPTASPMQLVYVRDRVAGTTSLVSVSSTGGLPDQGCERPAISADGSTVAYLSAASNLVAGDSNGVVDVFVRDLILGTNELVSVSSAGVQQTGASDPAPSVSANGRFVAFESPAPNLVAGDLNGALDVFVRDRQSASTERVSVSSAGLEGNFGSYAPSISADGRFVAFETAASNLVTGDSNSSEDVCVRDRATGTTLRVSVFTGGGQGSFASHLPSITADGGRIAFHSDESFVAGDTNGRFDVYVHDRASVSTERVSLSIHDTQGDEDSYAARISATGRYIVFGSDATNLVGNDTNGIADLYLRDVDASGFTSLCDAGLAGVIACPCANPPAGAGRGCDNSAGTGGAVLSASGSAYLTADLLVLTSTGELASSASIFAQGSSLIPSGAVFGQGVRCAGGSLKRLYVKSASGGAVSAPDTGSGDLEVSARSAFLGDPIAPGTSRYYYVYYRDPLVLGGCPAASTFNATQTGQVTWWP